MNEEELEKVKNCFQISKNTKVEASIQLGKFLKDDFHDNFQSFPFTVERCIDREIVDNIEMSVIVTDTETKIGDKTDSSNSINNFCLTYSN